MDRYWRKLGKRAEEGCEPSEIGKRVADGNAEKFPIFHSSICPYMTPDRISQYRSSSLSEITTYFFATRLPFGNCCFYELARQIYIFPLIWSFFLFFFNLGRCFFSSTKNSKFLITTDWFGCLEKYSIRVRSQVLITPLISCRYFICLIFTNLFPSKESWSYGC